MRLYNLRISVLSTLEVVALCSDFIYLIIWEFSFKNILEEYIPSFSHALFLQFESSLHPILCQNMYKLLHFSMTQFPYL